MNRIVIFIAGLLLCTKGMAQEPVDWANFSCFETQNASLAHAPKVVLMGDSIIELWNKNRPNFFSSLGWVSRAISGQTTSQMLVRFRADVIDLKPEIIIIGGGTNDIAQNTGYISLEHIFGNIVSMVDLARTNKIKPIICSILPTNDYPWRKGLNPAPKIIKLNQMLRTYAESQKITFIDYYSHMATNDGALIEAYSIDGVHPSNAGYEIMEEILSAGIKQAIKQKR